MEQTSQPAGERARASAEQPPYIEFVYDYASWALRPNSLHHDSTDQGPDNALQVKVVQYPTGRVVLRSRAGTIATGIWRADAIADRQQANPSEPSPLQWQRIEEALRSVRANAILWRVEFAPGVREPPPPVAVPEKPRSTLRRVLHIIYVAIVLLVFIPASVLWELYKPRVQGTRPNGAACILDSECASDHCVRKVCRVKLPDGIPDGDPCDYSSQCASHNCRANVCLRR